MDEILMLMRSSKSEIPEQNINCSHFQMINNVSNEQSLESIRSDHDYIMITECSSQIIIYVAGFIERQLDNNEM